METQNDPRQWLAGIHRLRDRDDSDFRALAALVRQLDPRAQLRAIARHVAAMRLRLRYAAPSLHKPSF